MFWACCSRNKLAQQFLSTSSTELAIMETPDFNTNQLGNMNEAIDVTWFDHLTQYPQQQQHLLETQPDMWQQFSGVCGDSNPLPLLSTDSFIDAGALRYLSYDAWPDPPWSLQPSC